MVPVGWERSIAAVIGIVADVVGARERVAGPRGAGGGMNRQRQLALYACFVGLALVVYAPALRGSFLSDDGLYLRMNPYVQALTLENVRTILDPSGAATAHVANYSPVFLLVLAVEWRSFGDDVLGYHVVNLLTHALVALLLAQLFARAGLPRPVALFGALLFLLHPANVEAVAWITQLKTVLCLLLAAAALLLHPRRPLLAATCFALGILTKTSALFALPVAVYDAWRRRGVSGDEGPRFGWLGVWLLLFLLYMGPQLAAFNHLGESPWPVDSDGFDHVRTIFAIGARYLVMATTSLGLSTFHNPPLTTPMLDPWWWGGLAAGAAILGRAVFVTRHSRAEAGFWLWAAAAYAPVSQLFPFLFPMGDRYLYVVLPGLIGAAGCGCSALGAGAFRNLDAATRVTLGRVALGLAFSVLVVLGVRSHERARVFESDQAMTLDAARHYPDGIVANLLRARRLGREGDLGGVLEALRHATAHGFDNFVAIETEPAFASMRGDPRFRTFVSELAGAWLAQARARGYSTQEELRGMAQAHLSRGEWREAEQLLRDALTRGGPADREVRIQLEELRRRYGAKPGTENDAEGLDRARPGP